MNAAGHDEFLPTRHRLLSRLRNWDDQEGWREFFDTYWKFLYSVAIKAGLSDADAKDVVQETVVAVARGLREGRFRATAGGSFKAWLKLIVQRRVVDLLRRRRSRPDHDAANLHDSDQAQELEAIVDPADFHPNGRRLVTATADGKAQHGRMDCRRHHGPCRSRGTSTRLRNPQPTGPAMVRAKCQIGAG